MRHQTEETGREKGRKQKRHMKSRREEQWKNGKRKDENEKKGKTREE